MSEEQEVETEIMGVFLIDGSRIDIKIPTGHFTTMFNRIRNDGGVWTADIGIPWHAIKLIVRNPKTLSKYSIQLDWNPGRPN